MVYIDTFKSEHSFETRKRIVDELRRKYPTKIPIIVGQGKGSYLPEIEKHRFLVEKDNTIGTLVYEIRKHITLRPEEALFLLINDTMLPTASTFSMIYDKHKDEDGFIYVTYVGENAFGYS